MDTDHYPDGSWRRITSELLDLHADSAFIQSLDLILNQVFWSLITKPGEWNRYAAINLLNGEFKMLCNFFFTLWPRFLIRAKRREDHYYTLILTWSPRGIMINAMINETSIDVENLFVLLNCCCLIPTSDDLRIAGVSYYCPLSSVSLPGIHWRDLMSSKRQAEDCSKVESLSGYQLHSWEPNESTIPEGRAPEMRCIVMSGRSSSKQDSVSVHLMPFAEWGKSRKSKMWRHLPEATAWRFLCTFHEIPVISWLFRGKRVTLTQDKILPPDMPC